MKISRLFAGVSAGALLAFAAAGCSNGPTPTPTPVAVSSSVPTVVASVLVQASSAAASPTAASSSMTASASASATTSALASTSPSNMPMAASDPTLNAGDVSALCAKAEQAARGAYDPNDLILKIVQTDFNTFCGAAAKALSLAEGNDGSNPDVTEIAVQRHNCFNSFSLLATYLKHGSDDTSSSAPSTSGTYLAYSDSTTVLTNGNANHVCGTDENPGAAPSSPIATYPGLG